MRDKLQYIFGLVNDWLKYAEAKNGILVAFNGATIFGFLQGWSSLHECIMPFVKYCFIPCAIISLTIAFSSFIAFLDITEVFKTVKSKSNIKLTEINIYFYGHIKDLKAEEYLNELYLSDGEHTPQIYSRSELDLANQIIINSKIAWKKYKYFEYASILTLCGAVIPIILLGIKSIIDLLTK